MDSSFSPKDEIWFLRLCHHNFKRSLPIARWTGGWIVQHWVFKWGYPNIRANPHTHKIFLHSSACKWWWGAHQKQGSQSTLTLKCHMSTLFLFLCLLSPCNFLGIMSIWISLSYSCYTIKANNDFRTIIWVVTFVITARENKKQDKAS
jgi:hypothetical protein